MSMNDGYLPSVMALLAAVKMKESKLSPEERELLKIKREREREDRRIVVCIQQGSCPDCQSKLKRGKKNKKNDYKRDWFCKKCDKTYSI